MTATYRLQMNADFTFADAEERVPYLAALGVSHLYLSPILQAVPGSAHGYDVQDHTRVSDDLGGRDGLLALAEAAHAAGLGIVVDVVPNHMAFVAPEHANAPLWHVLREGRDAETAHWFDIDWKAGGGRIGLPILGQSLPETLEAGELTLDEYDGQQVVRYHDHVFPVALGTEGDDVAEVLQRQHYQLASWRETESMLNYRRFFDVDQLIAVRVELDDVFDATHRLLLELNHDGVIDGFRIDHPDGLADPEGYLRRLRAESREGTWIWVEKILEGGERLPTSWDCEGTTGYDAMQAVAAALLDPATAAVLDECWTEAGGDAGLAQTVDRAKRTVVDRLLGPEVQRLTRRAREAHPDLDPDRLQSAVVELLVAGEVYRAYVRPDGRLSPLARKRLEAAFDRAVQQTPDLRTELEALLTLAQVEHAEDGPDVDFAVRLQQTWGPVMAKGIEDTTFYRWHRLVALNEVGGDPGALDHAGPESLHVWSRAQQERWPHGMTTLSTHDTKRSEDVRARLLAVAGDAEAWRACTRAFNEAADAAGVDRPTAHLVWQTLVGLWPVTEAVRPRLHGYLEKALREAKLHTAWVDGDPDYEARVLAFADRVVETGATRAAVEEALRRNQQAVRALTLGAKLVQLLLPGVPDVYQGTELVDLSLVDPDNRRPVDYEDRAARLARLDDAGAPRDLDDEKLLVTSRALRLRGRASDVFGPEGDYEPLTASTEHALGFVRGGIAGCVVTRAPQRLAAAGGWSDHTVLLPAGRWREVLSGHECDGGEVSLATLLAERPVALLERLEAPRA